jgi:hypothetical protein
MERTNPHKNTTNKTYLWLMLIAVLLFSTPANASPHQDNIHPIGGINLCFQGAMTMYASVITAPTIIPMIGAAVTVNNKNAKQGELRAWGTTSTVMGSIGIAIVGLAIIMDPIASNFCSNIGDQALPLAAGLGSLAIQIAAVSIGAAAIRMANRKKKENAHPRWKQQTTYRQSKTLYQTNL